MPAAPTVSVLITTYGRCHHLEPTLAPLLADPDAHEVVVVDDCSPDGTWELLQRLAAEHPRLRPIRPERNLWLAGARRFGARHATGDVLLAMDDDVVAHPGLVGRHRRHHAEHDHLLVLGYMPVRLPATRRPGDFVLYLYAEAYERHVERWERDHDFRLTSVWAGNVSFRRDDYLRAVGDDELVVRYGDDQDLGLRLLRAGVRSAVFDREARADHAFSRSLDPFLRDGRSHGRSLAIMHAAYREELGPLSAEPNVDGPGWLRALVVAADRPRLRPPLVAALRAAHLVAGRLHHWGAEEGFALAVRAIGQRAGVREGERELRADVAALPPELSGRRGA